MSTPYIGSKISLVSKAEIRYEGILYMIDPKESTIALAKVRCHGTETRVAQDSTNPVSVASRDEIYEYIIFKAGDIKDLTVSETPQPAAHIYTTVTLPHDPAIVSASKESASGAHSFASQNLDSTQKINSIEEYDHYHSNKAGKKDRDGKKDQALEQDDSSNNIHQQKSSQLDQKSAKKKSGSRRRKTDSEHQQQKSATSTNGGSGMASHIPPILVDDDRRSSSTNEAVENLRRYGPQRSKYQQNTASSQRRRGPGGGGGGLRDERLQRRRRFSSSGCSLTNGGCDRDDIAILSRMHLTPSGGSRYRTQRRNDNYNNGGVRFQHNNQRFFDMSGYRSIHPSAFLQAPPVAPTPPPPMVPFNYRNGGGFVGGPPMMPRYGRRYQQMANGGLRPGMLNRSQHPPTLKFDSDYDFEQANIDFKNKEVSKKGVIEESGASADTVENKSSKESGEVEAELGRQQMKNNEQNASLAEKTGQGTANKEYYNKTVSFFDKISCESLERGQSKAARHVRRQERQLNQQTFGQATIYRQTVPHYYGAAAAAGFMAAAAAAAASSMPNGRHYFPSMVNHASPAPPHHFHHHQRTNPMLMGDGGTGHHPAGAGGSQLVSGSGPGGHHSSYNGGGFRSGVGRFAY